MMKIGLVMKPCCDGLHLRSPLGFQTFHCFREKFSSCIVVKDSSSYEGNLQIQRSRLLLSEDFMSSASLMSYILSVFTRLTIIATGFGVSFASPGSTLYRRFTVVRKLTRVKPI